VSYRESKKEIMQLIFFQFGPNKYNIFNTKFMQTTCLSFDVKKITLFFFIPLNFKVFISLIFETCLC